MPVLFCEPEGGARPGGTAPVTIATANDRPTVKAIPFVEWDLDGDGDFSESEEAVTAYVMDGESLTGRDWPSHLTGKAGPGQLNLTLLNDDHRFDYFNASSPLATPPFSLDVGRKIRLRVHAEAALDCAIGQASALTDAPDLTGDQTLGAEAYPRNLTTIQTLAAEFTAAGNQRSIMLQVNATGFPRLIWTTDGTIGTQVIATATVPLTKIRRQAVWGELAVNVAGVWRVRFYTADRDTDTPVQLGANVTGGAPTSVFNSTGGATYGSHSSGTEPWSGLIYRGTWRSGLIDSTDLRARPRFLDQPINQPAGLAGHTDDEGVAWLYLSQAIVTNPVEALGDPVLLARDRFAGPVGPMVQDELGTPWVARTAPLRTFGIVRDSAGATMAEPDLQGDSSTSSIHIATLDVGTADYYAQLRWRFLDQENDLGIVYRFVDTSNYGICLVSAVPTGNTTQGAVSLAELNAGVFTTTAFTSVELRNDDYLGVFVDGSTAVILHNGVPLLEDSSYSSASHHVGLYADWNVQRPPAAQEFYVWDGAPDPIAGVLWTGDVTDVRPSSPVGGKATVELSAEGRLARAAGTDITVPNSIGKTEPNTPGNISPGSTTGVMVGATLGRVGLIHPPGFLDLGDVTVGGTELSAGKAIDALRAYEEAELGFVHESPEGHVDYDARSGRPTQPGTVIWGDNTSTAQFQFSHIELLDWRREIVNRVESGLSPKLPRVIGFQAENTANPDIIIPMPTIANGAEPGDLFLVVIASSHFAGTEWEKPIGWTVLREAGTASGRLRIYAKRVEEDDIGDSVTFYDSGTNGEFTSWQLLVKNFYGDVGQGLALSDVHGFGLPTSVAKARAGANRPQAVFPPWAPAPTVVLANRAGMTGGAVDNDENEDEFYAPNGFAGVSSAASAALDTGLQMAFRNTNESVIQPSPWLNDPAGAGFQLYDFVETVTIAIRGFAGDPPETKGGQTIVTDDFASQTARGGLIRTHENPARMFATVADAEAYNDAVLATFANDRPLFRVEWPATKSALYRQQAYTRRVGDRIRLVANTESGAGVDGDYFIESVNHRISDGGTRWTVTWELSPA